jgi:methyltransferase family protein
LGFESQLESLDIGLFDGIPSQTSIEDKRSLLALHVACRRQHPRFRWLEIGSHLGGSLQALIRDPACEAIDSIDLRPELVADDRIATVSYPDNSTERMTRLLGELPEADLGKLRTYDAHTGQLNPQDFERPDVCLIDAEHTVEACRRDAEFCRLVLRGRGVVAFHDVGVIYRAVAGFVDSVRASGTACRLAYLPDLMFAVELGPSDLLDDPAVIGRQLMTGSSLLAILCENDRYRAVLDGRRGRLLRRLGILRVDDPTLVAERG